MKKRRKDQGKMKRIKKRNYGENEDKAGRKETTGRVKGSQRKIR